ncbi:MAG: DUF4038 domain-containing protein [Verrucomicrobiae bacterium]|nr:DUF4038 domain-containing protein [Verrucomicrobiae bacterium]
MSSKHKFPSRLKPTPTPLLILQLCATSLADPIRVHPVNPHYFEYDGRLLVLVSSDQHYGAVIDGEFDYAKYLTELRRHGMNVTRIYPGAMFEPQDKFVPGNPLGPRPGKHVLPWAKSTQPGANPALAEPGQASFKFDLDRWNDSYFDRLRSFVALAQKLGIIVEVVFFNGMYADCWPLMPMYHRNNIQGVGRYEPEECGLFTTTDPKNSDVITYQKAYVSKITRELNKFDNVIYDICDEPSLQGLPDGKIRILPDEKVAPWIRVMKDAFMEAEHALPKKHLLGQTVENLSPDFSDEDWCKWLPTEYVKPSGKALDRHYGDNKPLVVVESDYFGGALVKPYTVDDVRVEGWWFMLRGGAGFINLNGEYYRGNETGGDLTKKYLIPQKMILRQFLESFDLLSMKPFAEVKLPASGGQAVALAEPGRQYAVYLFRAGDDGQWGAHFSAKPGSYQDTLVIEKVPPGTYKVEWLDPTSGITLQTQSSHWNGGDLCLTSPIYSLDIALRIVRK